MILSDRLKNGIKILEHWQACSWVIDQKAILQCCDPGVGIHVDIGLPVPGFAGQVSLF